MVSEIVNSRKGYRSRLEIIRDILLVVGGDGCKKTHIMYRANLSFNLLKSYLESVLGSGLVEFDGDSCYTITEKGEMFLEFYEAYEEECREVEKQVNSLKSGREALEKMLMPNGSD